MAIAFARARVIHLTESSGATRDFAYVGRTVMADPRAYVGPFDYSHLRNDLAYVEVLLPPNVPQIFLDPALLANTLDAIEIQKIRTPLSERTRMPQVAMAVIVALPPQFEVSLHEALTIARRIVRYPCGPHPIPIHLAIHSASINRHAHADIALRPMNLDGSFGLKVPDLFVRFRSQAEGIRVAEGTGWADLSWEIQQAFFTERGMDLVVDPPAPAPDRHLPIGIPDETYAVDQYSTSGETPGQYQHDQGKSDESNRDTAQRPLDAPRRRIASALCSVHRQRGRQACAGGSDSGR